MTTTASGCPNKATHKIFTDYGSYLVCEDCVKASHMTPKRVRRRWKNWTQTIAEKQCQCEHIEHTGEEEKMTTTAKITREVHIAGPFDRIEQVQKCRRCGEVLYKAFPVEERQTPGPYPEGARVEVTRTYQAMILMREEATCATRRDDE